MLWPGGECAITAVQGPTRGGPTPLEEGHHGPQEASSSFSFLAFQHPLAGNQTIVPTPTNPSLLIPNLCT